MTTKAEKIVKINSIVDSLYAVAAKVSAGTTVSIDVDGTKVIYKSTRQTSEAIEIWENKLARLEGKTQIEITKVGNRRRGRGVF